MSCLCQNWCFPDRFIIAIKAQSMVAHWCYFHPGNFCCDIDWAWGGLCIWGCKDTCGIMKFWGMLEKIRIIFAFLFHWFANLHSYWFTVSFMWTQVASTYPFAHIYTQFPCSPQWLHVEGGGSVRQQPTENAPGSRSSCPQCHLWPQRWLPGGLTTLPGC